MARNLSATAAKLRALAEHPNTPAHEAARAREQYRKYTRRIRTQDEEDPPAAVGEALRFFEGQADAAEKLQQRLDQILAQHGARLVPRRERRRKEK